MESGNAAPPGWNKRQDWFWEGHVQAKIVSYMTTEEGYVIIQTARTDSYEPKPDIVATKSGKQKIVEVKGYPLEESKSKGRSRA